MSTCGALTVQVLILAVLVLGDVGVVTLGQTSNSFSFPNVSTSAQNYSILTYGDANVDSAEKAITLNTLRAMASNGDSVCGRAVHTEKIQLVDKASGTVASFNTSFTFSFQSNTNSCGDGMLFMFSTTPSFTLAQETTAGGAFCVLNFNNPNSTLFAVEFDSYYNSVMYDPSDSHIGVDFKDMSLGASNLCNNTTTVCSYFCKSGYKNYTAWIDYDSAKNQLEIRFRDGDMADSRGKPVDPVVNGTYKIQSADFLQILDEEMYVGFVGSTGGAREVHTIWSWEFETTGMPNNNPLQERSRTKVIIASISAAVAGALLVAGIWQMYVYFKLSRTSAINELPLYALDSDADCRSYTYTELKNITKDFSELLASGGFGNVYKGALPSGSLVAVKRIKKEEEAGAETFLAEVQSLRQTRHRNLLQLRGWSQSEKGLFIVFDFMCNGSLDKWLHPKPNLDHNNQSPLSWDVRHAILEGVASGLEYLHEDGKNCVLHRDIKSSNVLLDEEWRPYLGDFGLARLVDHRLQHKSTLPAGTLGYMAPEMLHTGRATKETDVYAFGMLVLETVCGKRPVDFQDPDAEDNVLVDTVWRAHEAGHVLEVTDPRLVSQLDPENKVMVENVVHVGLLCCLPDPTRRPSMRLVNQWFQAKAAMALPQLPASKPQYFYPSTWGLHASSSSGTVESESSSFLAR